MTKYYGVQTHRRFISVVWRFLKKGKKWYGWSDEEAARQWDDACRDPHVPKSRDCVGNLCVAKLETRISSSGVHVGTFRGVKENEQTEIEDGASETVFKELRDRAPLSSWRCAQ